MSLSAERLPARVRIGTSCAPRRSSTRRMGCPTRRSHAGLISRTRPCRSGENASARRAGWIGSTSTASWMRRAASSWSAASQRSPTPSVVAMRVHADALGADLHVGPRCSRETMPHHFRAPSARGRGDTRRAFMAGLARVGRMDVRRRARPPSWAVDGSGDRRIRGVGVPFQGSVLQMGGQAPSFRAGADECRRSSPWRSRNGRPRARPRGSPPRRTSRPGMCRALGTGWPHRHHLFGCRDRWIAAGSYPLATSSRSCRACRYRGPRPSRAARRRSPRS
jgi:hypothetical protein